MTDEERYIKFIKENFPDIARLWKDKLGNYFMEEIGDKQLWWMGMDEWGEVDIETPADKNLWKKYFRK